MRVQIELNDSEVKQALREYVAKNAVEAGTRDLAGRATIEVATYDDDLDRDAESSWADLQGEAADFVRAILVIEE